MADVLFVQPHFDDVALSCGGQVARRASQGKVRMVTVFAESHDATVRLSSLAQHLHRKWGIGDDPVSVRRKEDGAAAAILGAEQVLLPFRDALYRGPYVTFTSLTGAVHPSDTPLVEQVGGAVRALLQKTPAEMFFPLAVGGHVDHVICFLAGEKLRAEGLPVAYYEDFPYALAPGALAKRREALGDRLVPEVVDTTDCLDKRIAAIEQYVSQLQPTFAPYGAPADTTRRYAQSVSERPGGAAERLWRL